MLGVLNVLHVLNMNRLQRPLKRLFGKGECCIAVVVDVVDVVVVVVNVDADFNVDRCRCRPCRSKLGQEGLASIGDLRPCEVQ